MQDSAAGRHYERIPTQESTDLSVDGPQIGLVAGRVIGPQPQSRMGQGDLLPRPPRPEPQFCTKQYEPVCARRGDRQTFANACLADRAGYRIVRDGPCRDGGGGGEEQTFCTREYAPVWARRRGETRTFPNACEARAADYRIVGGGPC